MRFVAGTTIRAGSPKGRLLIRNIQDFPDIPIEEQLREVDRLFWEASGRKRYRVLPLVADRAMRLSLQARRDRR